MVGWVGVQPQLKGCRLYSCPVSRIRTGEGEFAFYYHIFKSFPFSFVCFFLHIQNAFIYLFIFINNSLYLFKQKKEKENVIRKSCRRKIIPVQYTTTGITTSTCRVSLMCNLSLSLLLLIVIGFSSGKIGSIFRKFNIIYMLYMCMYFYIYIFDCACLIYLSV